MLSYSGLTALPLFKWCHFTLLCAVMLTATMCKAKALGGKASGCKAKDLDFKAKNFGLKAKAKPEI